MEKVQNTIFEMITDRNYDYSLYNKRELENYVRTDTNTLLGIYIFDEMKVGVKAIKDILDIVFEKDLKHIICVYKNEITTFARQYLEQVCLENKIRIEQFSFKDLTFNVTKHQLVPKHEIISSTEVLNLLTTFKINRNNLPLISVNDPVIKYLGAVKYDIVKIYRKDQDFISSIYYRKVT